MGDRTGDASTSWQVFQQRTLHAASQDCNEKKSIHRCMLLLSLCTCSVHSRLSLSDTLRAVMSGSLHYELPFFWQSWP